MLAGAAEQWKVDPEFSNIEFMSVHHGEDRGTPLWNLASYGHYDNPVGGGVPPSIFGTPFGVLDGGFLFFRGFDETAEAPERFKGWLRQMQGRTKASARLQAEYMRQDDGNVLIAVTIDNLTDLTLGAGNAATLAAAVLTNEKHPYFSVTARHQIGGGLCAELEPGKQARCGLPLGDVSDEVLRDSKVFVTLTYRPDPNRESHDALQSTIAKAPPAPDQPPVVAREIGDIVVPMGTLDHAVDLRGVFTDPDNDDEAIALSLSQNSNPGLMSAEIVGQDLTLTFTPEGSGEAQLTIEADSNGMKVNTSFSVRVLEGGLGNKIYMPVQKNEP